MKEFRFLLIPLLVFSYATISCNDTFRINKKLHNFLTTEIVIPTDLVCISNRQVSKICMDTLNSYKLIVYYDSLSCSSCEISHLATISPLCNMLNNHSCSVLIIFSPKAIDLDNILLQLKIANYSMPVYIDSNKTFCRLNGSVSDNSHYHCFCMDESNKPIFVGNPLSNVNDIKRLLKIMKKHN